MESPQPGHLIQRPSGIPFFGAGFVTLGSRPEVDRVIGFNKKQNRDHETGVGKDCPRDCLDEETGSAKSALIAIACRSDADEVDIVEVDIVAVDIAAVDIVAVDIVDVPD